MSIAFLFSNFTRVQQDFYFHKYAYDIISILKSFICIQFDTARKERTEKNLTRINIRAWDVRKLHCFVYGIFTHMLLPMLFRHLLLYEL